MNAVISVTSADILRPGVFRFHHADRADAHQTFILLAVDLVGIHGQRLASLIALNISIFSGLVSIHVLMTLHN
jgi:hypothetical protein